MKEDQERVKNQLMQTVPLLCQLGLHFERKLRISGYIKIHIDNNDKIVIDIEREYESSNSLTAENDDNRCNAITTSSSNIRPRRTSTSANSLRDTTSPTRPAAAEGTCSGQSTCIGQQHNMNCNVQTQRSTHRPIQHKSSNTQYHRNISGQGRTTALKRSSFTDSNASNETTISTRMPQNEANDFKSQNTENYLHLFERNVDDDDDFATDDSTVTPTCQGAPSRQPTLSPSPAKKRKKCPVCKGTIFGSITAHMKKHQHSVLKVPLANGTTATDGHKKIVNVSIHSSSSVCGTAAVNASKENGSKTVKEKVKRLRMKTLAALSEEGNLAVERFTQWLTTRTNPTTATKYAGEVKTVIRAVGGCTQQVNVESVYEKYIKPAMDDVQQERLQRRVMANRLRRLTYFCDFALTQAANDNDQDRYRYNHLKQEIVKWNKSLHKRNAPQAGVSQMSQELAFLCKQLNQYSGTRLASTFKPGLI